VLLLVADRISDLPIRPSTAASGFS
jgi:hypothetical protein